MSGENGAPAPSFEERLKAARKRRGLDALDDAGPAGRAQDATALGVAVRVGVELLSALVVAVAIGWGLDRWLHTMPLFLIIFVLLGGAAGILNLWRTIAPKAGAGR